MARSLGTMKLSSNFEPRLGAPLDARMVVATTADLTASGAFPYPYIGMLVSVQATKELYMYNGGTITAMSGWDKVGGSTISGTIGNSSTPMWLNNGTFTAVGAKFLSANQTGEVAFAGGEDLNDYTTPGVWGTSGGSSGSTVAQNILNKPSPIIGGGFRIYVESCGGDVSYVRQTLYYKCGRVFWRTYLAGTWGDWLEIYGKLATSSVTDGHLLAVDGTTGRFKDSGYAASDFVSSSTLSDYLPKSGGTLTGTLTAKGSVYTDARDQGALNMNNSNIYGLNAIYMADASDNAGEGINWINSTTTLDTLWASGGVLLFTPNRTDGTATTAANSQKVGRFTVNPTSGQVVITDGAYGGMKSSGYTIAKSVPSDAVFTDAKVTQTATSTNANYEILFSETADNSTRTEGARKYSNLKFNPSTGNLQATQLNGVTIGSSPKFTDTTYTNGTGLSLSGTIFSVSQANASTILNLLSTGDSDAQAADYLIAQYAGGGTSTTTYHRRPVSKVVNSTVVKAALGTVSTTNNKYLRDDGTWQIVNYATQAGYTNNYYMMNFYKSGGAVTLNYHYGLQVFKFNIANQFNAWQRGMLKLTVFMNNSMPFQVWIYLYRDNGTMAYPDIKVFYKGPNGNSSCQVGWAAINTSGTNKTYGLYVCPNTAQASGSTTCYPVVFCEEMSDNIKMAVAGDAGDFSTTLAVSSSSYNAGSLMF